MDIHGTFFQLLIRLRTFIIKETYDGGERRTPEPSWGSPRGSEPVGAHLFMAL